MMDHIMRWTFRAFKAFDWPLLLILVLFGILGMVVMHSAVGDTDGRFVQQGRNFLLAFMVMWFVALWTPSQIMKSVIPFYVLGCLLLLAVELFGSTSKGATRWLDLGFIRLQPSEMMKLCVPMMLAWYFDKYRSDLRIRDFIVAGILLLIPFALIIKQPDLGTALLVFATGFCVIYFAGLSFKLLTPIFIIGVIFLGLILYFESTLCAPGFDWVILHEYQKTRVCTLLDPNTDPLGKGFHTIQGMICNWFGWSLW